MKEKKFDPTAKAGSAMLAIPGKYTVSLDMVVRGEVRHLAGPVQFKADLLNNSTLPREDREAIVAFAKKVTNMARVMRGTHELADDNVDKIMTMEQTILQSSDGNMDMLARAMKIENELKDILYTMDGPKAKASEEELPPMPVAFDQQALCHHRKFMEHDPGCNLNHAERLRHSFNGISSRARENENSTG